LLTILILNFRNIEEILAEKGETVQKLQLKSKEISEKLDNNNNKRVEIESNIELVLEDNTSTFLPSK
jgi:hypothetical protein